LWNLRNKPKSLARFAAKIGQQRDNWNTLLLNSINMIILTVATMAGVAAISGTRMPLLALKLSFTLLYSAATGMLLIMVVVVLTKPQVEVVADEESGGGLGSGRHLFGRWVLLEKLWFTEKKKKKKKK
jgi:hypothetical protein